MPKYVQTLHRTQAAVPHARLLKPSGKLRTVDARTFADPVPPGLAGAAWNFAVVPVADGGCVLHTETRILTGDAGACRRFRLYWTLVRPGSGLIRRLMLRAIRAEAERSVPPAV
jgi:hypothetical protein